ncbi:hypothetical protein LQW54_008347 [Pestalotiopsis sp. IQ-011]
MPSLFSLSAAAACVGLVLATPPLSHLHHGQRNACLSAPDGPRLAAQFADLVGNYTAAKADALLLPDYEDYSDGINSLTGKPLGSETFAGREAFKAAQVGHGGTPMVVDDVLATTCDTVVWTWTATFGAANQTARGINVVRYVPDPANGTWWVARVDMEMNSLVYLQDLGGSWTPPTLE